MSSREAWLSYPELLVLYTLFVYDRGLTDAELALVTRRSRGQLSTALASLRAAGLASESPFRCPPGSLMPTSGQPCGRHRLHAVTARGRATAAAWEAGYIELLSAEPPGSWPELADRLARVPLPPEVAAQAATDQPHRQQQRSPNLGRAGPSLTSVRQRHSPDTPRIGSPSKGSGNSAPGRCVRPRTWTAERIESELADALRALANQGDLDRFPTQTDLRSSGYGALADAITRHGGVSLWSDRMGIPLLPRQKASAGRRPRRHQTVTPANRPGSTRRARGLRMRRSDR